MIKYQCQKFVLRERVSVFFIYFGICWGKEICFFNEETEIGLVTWRDANTRQMVGMKRQRTRSTCDLRSEGDT